MWMPPVGYRGYSSPSVIGKGQQLASFTELSSEVFIDALASKEPVPGGGSASALVGAIGVALGNMVGSLTVGKPKYDAVQDDIIELKVKADALQAELLELVEEDARVFAPLSRAYGMPSSTDEDAAEKARVMEECLRECSAVPLRIMECCGRAIDLHEEFAAKGAAIAISDVGCGVVCCKAALEAASLNVLINTKSMQDRTLAEELNAQAEELVFRYSAKANSIYENVKSRFQ
jgi:formiminotetrahydrofolate cyclodeaminase